jgi:hypothetical protein
MLTSTVLVQHHGCAQKIEIVALSLSGDALIEHAECTALVDTSSYRIFELRTEWKIKSE